MVRSLDLLASTQAHASKFRGSDHHFQQSRGKASQSFPGWKSVLFPCPKLSRTSVNHCCIMRQHLSRERFWDAPPFSAPSFGSIKICYQLSPAQKDIFTLNFCEYVKAQAIVFCQSLCFPSLHTS
jgi:hypothetical protein